MRNRFDRELANLNRELIEMGSLIEEAIDDAISALLKKDVSRGEHAVNDNLVDEKEREIERHCLKLLLQQQPVATDLRLISTALKMIADMERIGDQAADISEIAIYIAEHNTTFLNIDFTKMATATKKMVKDCIDAFVNKDIELAHDVIAYDDVVDELFNHIKYELINAVRTDGSLGEQVVDYLMVSKYFERIGDHAVNVAEWVIFSLTGEHKNERII